MSQQTNLASAFNRLVTAINTLFGRVLPAGGANGQVLTKNSANNYDVTWSTISAGSSEIQQAFAALGANTTLPTTNAIVNLATVSLSAGTWLITGMVTFTRTATTAGFLDIHIGATGSTVATKYASSSHYHASVANVYISAACQRIITLTATTSVTLSASHSAGATSNIVRATSRAGSPNATTITAIKLA